MSFQIKYFNCSYAESARTGRIVGQLCLHYNIHYNAKLTKTNSELDFKNFGVKKEKKEEADGDDGNDNDDSVSTIFPYISL